jgi:hypothetical protein
VIKLQNDKCLPGISIKQNQQRGFLMKKTLLLFVSAAVFVLMATLSLAAEKPSIELGQKLFNNPGLGASQNSISCNTCHLNGDGLQKAGKQPDLAATINKCIVGPLEGQGISEETVAMKSLKMYIKSLGK